MRFLIILQGLTVLAASQPAPISSINTDIPPDANPTPDAIPLDFLKDISPPTYSTATGLISQVVPYATSSAVAAASSVVLNTPLSVFPAVSTAAINAAGEDDSTSAPSATQTPVKRSLVKDTLHKRTACQPEPRIANSYSLPLDATYDSFRSNSTFSDKALSVSDPQGYFAAFKGKLAASSALMYLGYTLLQEYDPSSCSSICNTKQGCLSFNIYFEMDPSVDPGDSCPNPAPLVNIKCDFWGAALDSSTAASDGNLRQQFHVAIAGSNAYTSNTIGGPISGWTVPEVLGNAVMNAPLRDCAGTWTYMGYKLLQSGYDVNNCAAACNAQNDYNIAHPPSTGITPLCAAFGSYQLRVTQNGTTGDLGQMCTFYTSNWDSKYAVNTAAYNDGIGAKYTYTSSFFYSRDDRQPVCQVDLQKVASDTAALSFCTSLVSYTPTSTTTVSVTSTGGVSTQYATTTITSTVTSSAALAVRYALEPRSAVDVVRRVTAPQTPAVLASLSAPVRISVACSQVATGAATLTTVVATVPASVLTTTISTTTTQTVSATCTPSAITAVGNMVKNGDFATGDLGSWTATTDVYQASFPVTNEGLGCNKALSVQGSSTTSSFRLRLQQAISIPAGRNYKFSYWVKAGATARGCITGLVVTDSTTYSQQTFALAGTSGSISTSWTQITQTYSLTDVSNNAGSYVQVVASCSAPTANQVQDNRVLLSGISITDAGPADGVLDGSLESSSLSHWKFTAAGQGRTASYSLPSGQAYDGTYALSVVSFKDQGFSGTLSGTLNVTAGQAYSVSVAMRADDPNMASGCSVAMLAGSSQLMTIQGLTQTWKLFTRPAGTWTAPSPAPTSISFSISCSGSGLSQKSLYFDGISVAPVS
ncbi:Carbohydrate-binding CenC-like protein [Neofusicoccum parvum]|nr:Carbohydrate-binding CenC-like protein [Neofusicoccum parvum]